MGCRHRLALWTCRRCRVRRVLDEYVGELSEYERLAAKTRARRDAEGEALGPDAA